MGKDDDHDPPSLIIRYKNKVIQFDEIDFFTLVAIFIKKRCAPDEFFSEFLRGMEENSIDLNCDTMRSLFEKCVNYMQENAEFINFCESDGSTIN